jgi:hypothetical protein
LGPGSRRWCDFSISGVFLAHLLFFIRVIEDDDIAVIGRTEKPKVEVTEELSGKLLIP